MYGGLGYVNQFNQVITNEFVTYTFYQNITNIPGSNWEYVVFGGVLATGAETANTFEIKDVSVKELGENWSVGTGWSIGENKLIGSGAQSNYTSQANIFTPNENKSYKLTLKVEDYTSGYFRILTQGATYESGNISGDGLKELYIHTGEPTDGSFLISWSGLFDGSITNISVQELGADWIINDGWSIGEDKAIWNADSATQNENINQSISFGVNKSYKVTFTIGDVVGSPVRVLMRATGDTMQDITDSWEDLTGGTYTRYFNSLYANTQFDISGRYDVGDSFSITNILVQEVGQDWHTNTNWVLTENDAKSDGTSNNDLNQSKWFPELGETYKIEYNISLISQGAYKIKLGGETTPPRDAPGTWVEYVTATDLSDGGGRLRIQIDDNAIGTISSISVYDINGLIDIEFTNQLTSKKFDFPNIGVLTTNGRYSSMSITPPAETTPPSNATMVEGMYLVTFKLDQLNKVIATRLAFVGSLPAFKEATYDANKVTDGTAYNVYVNG